MLKEDNKMMEKTVIIVKHDGVQRSLVGEIIKRFENKGLKLAALKMVHATRKMAEEQYKVTPEAIEKTGGNTIKAYEKKGVKLKETKKQITEKVFKWLRDYLTEGPVVAMVFEGYHAIEIGRKITGHAEPRQAEIGTIRGDFALESYELADKKERPLRNIMHASGNKQEAENELIIWFKKDEIYDWEKIDWGEMH